MGRTTGDWRWEMGGTAWRAPRQLSAGRNKNARVKPSAGAAGRTTGMAKINHSTRRGMNEKCNRCSEIPLSILGIPKIDPSTT